MDKLIKKVSNFISFAVVFAVSAVIYFNYKGFTYENGEIILKKQVAHAEQRNGVPTVLPSDIHINASDKYAIGSVNAPITLYEYSSLGCPHCADFHMDVLPKLEQEYVSQGLLRIVFVNFPLDKNSMKAAMISRCMTYENYHHFIYTLFDNQRSWWLDTDDEKLYRYAAEHGLSYDETQACANDDMVAQEIISDRQQALKQLHITGTPAVLINTPYKNEIIYGAPSYAKLKNIIDGILYPTPTSDGEFYE